MPGFSALDVFVAVARHRSFRRAAAERGVSPSALSHVIRGLERTLGVPLFNRTNRSIRITAAGERLLARVGPALGEIAEAVAELGHYKAIPSGPLRLNVPRNAAEIIMKPIVSRFLAVYPEVKLEVVTSDGIVDIVAEGFDAGIRATNLLAQDMVTVPVGPKLRFAVVGSPDYLRRRGAPESRLSCSPMPASSAGSRAAPPTLGCSPGGARRWRSRCPARSLPTTAHSSWGQPWTASA